MSQGSRGAGRKRVIAVGSPMQDLYAQVEDDFVSQLKTLNKGDAMLMPLADFRRVLQSAEQSSSILCMPGGVAANTVKVLGKFNHPCLMVGKLGDDKVGEEYARALRTEFAVGDRLVRTADFPTGQVLCLITPDGQRSFCFHTGASSELTPSDLAPVLPSLRLGPQDFLYLDAYNLLCGGVTRHVLEVAKAAGALVGLNLCSTFIVEAHRAEILESLAQFLDILFCNEDESFALTCGLGPKDACVHLSSMCSTVVVTAGEAGCYVCQDGVLHRGACSPVTALDTTGAGDFFAGGYLHGWLRGQPVDECVRAGNCAAAAIVAVIGTNVPSDTWTQLRVACRVDAPPQQEGNCY